MASVRCCSCDASFRIVARVSRRACRSANNFVISLVLGRGEVFNNFTRELTKAAEVSNAELPPWPPIGLNLCTESPIVTMRSKNHFL